MFFLVFPTGPTFLPCFLPMLVVPFYPLFAAFSYDSFSPFFALGHLTGFDVNHCPSLLPYLRCRRSSCQLAPVRAPDRDFFPSQQGTSSRAFLYDALIGLVSWVAPFLSRGGSMSHCLAHSFYLHDHPCSQECLGSPSLLRLRMSRPMSMVTQ